MLHLTKLNTNSKVWAKKAQQTIFTPFPAGDFPPDRASSTTSEYNSSLPAMSQSYLSHIGCILEHIQMLCYLLTNFPLFFQARTGWMLSPYYILRKTMHRTKKANSMSAPFNTPNPSFQWSENINLIFFKILVHTCLSIFCFFYRSTGCPPFLELRGGYQSSRLVGRCSPPFRLPPIVIIFADNL